MVPFETGTTSSLTRRSTPISLSKDMDWEELKRKVRSIESRLEDKCQEYSNIAQRLNSDLLYDEENPLLENNEGQILAVEIEDLLKALKDGNDAISQLLINGAATGRAASSQALLQRYREIHYYYTTEYQKTSLAIQRKKESTELMRSSRSSRDRRSEWGNSQIDQLLRERNAIHSSMRGVGTILSQAVETKDSLRAQRHGITGATSSLSGLSSKLPGISRVVDAIQRKKTRDNVIVGLMIAGCICFTIWYIF